MINTDCRYYIGEKPCKFKRGCDLCPHYDKIEERGRILVIKIGAIGDVLRTTPLLSGIKRICPKSHITWLVDKNGVGLLEGNKLIDRVYPLNLESWLSLQVEEFDQVISLDKVKEAASIATFLKAKKRVGFGLNKLGNLISLNKESDYALELGVSDELKFRKNKKTYQEIIFEMTGLEYKGDEYILNISDSDKKRGKEIGSKYNLKEDDFVVGLNTGAGKIFATKRWTICGFAALAELLVEKLDAKVILLGGPEEIQRNRKIEDSVKVKVINSGNDNTIKEFAGIIDLCDVVVTGDTIAMHLGIALKKKVVAIFGSTCHQEVDLYGRGEKIVSDMDCVPCYKSSCDKKPTCMDNLSAEKVFEVVKRVRYESTAGNVVS